MDIVLARSLIRLGCMWLATVVVLVALPSTARGQASQYALRFYGTGTGQQDRVRIQIDDDAPGPDASAPCDVGAGDFTVEFWLRGQLADNGSSNSGGDVETYNLNWIDGNIIVDRDIFGGSARDWGASVAGGFVRFGTGSGDAGGDTDHTIEGDVNVLDGAWHHVALVRDAASGIKRIYVDALLDFAGSPGASQADISYPNNGAPGQVTPWGPYIVIAAEKHDAGPAYPSFNGFVDEVRIWEVARSQNEILDTYDRVVAADSLGLVAYYRFEDGSGTSAADSSTALSPDGEVIAGVAGNGEWVSFAVNPLNTAPISTAGSPPITVVAFVAASDRNADYFPAFGEELSNFYDGLGLCMGREANGGAWQAGLQFALDAPPQALIVSADLQMVATPDASGSPQVQIRGYDAANAAPFSASHNHALTAHQPLAAPAVSWTLPPFSEGEVYQSPDLAPIIQAAVNGPDWLAGNVIGVVLDGSVSLLGDHWRCLRNFNSGQPAQLTVTYIAKLGCVEAEDCDDGDACSFDVCRSGACDHLPGQYGDANFDGSVDLQDILCVLDAFRGSFGDCSAPATDLAPCVGNGVVDLLDIIAVLDAFAGLDACGCS